ncbi:MAG TPA: ABC transporter substrate-binding protein [Noviherbaspirillum sp.]|nr:ABC transporter substrate-binding protein [Noviherbaspirillum sp.]
MLIRLKPFFKSLLLAATLLSFTPAADAAGNSIVIGHAVDLSGPNASIGRDYVAGIKTCFDMVNAAGGINGKRIQYVARDDRGLPEVSASVASDLIDREQADYLIGGVGDEATQAVLDTPAFKRSGHILFAPLAVADYAASGRVLFWRPSYKQEIRHIFTHFGKIGVSNVGVIYQDTPLNQQAYRSLGAVVQEYRMTIKGTAKIGIQGDRIAEEAARLAALKPGFVLVIADTISTAQFLKEYRKHDGQTFVAGTSLINLSTLSEIAGKQAVEWTVFSQVVPNPNAATTLLQLEHLNMMKKFRDEAVSSMTLEGFAAAKALVKAIQQSKRGERGALHDFIAQRKDIDLGGLSVAPANGSNRLSSYLDIALLRKGSGLMF